MVIKSQITVLRPIKQKILVWNNAYVWNYLYLAQTFNNPVLPLLYLESGTFLDAIDLMQLEQKYNLHSEHDF